MDTKKRADALKVNMSWVQKEKARCREKASRFRKLYPEKYAARDASAGIPKTKGFHNHHWSYNTEHRKDVISMSAKDHVLVHRYTVYDQERAMYRRLDGTLIDSREAAIAYYSTLKD
jgi:hypothetical protein